MAASSQCTGSEPKQTTNPNPSGQSFSQSGQGRSTAVPPNGNYSDIEQLSRQGTNRNPSEFGVLPPEPLTEFQNFVVSTSGRSLPVYGAEFFRRIPSTFAPLDMTPVPADYVIGPGDELRIRVWGQVNFTVNVRVDRSGEIFFATSGNGAHVGHRRVGSRGTSARGDRDVCITTSILLPTWARPGQFRSISPEKRDVPGCIP